MDEERLRDWRDCVPGYIRITGWPHVDKEFRNTALCAMVQVFGVRKGGQYIELYGYRSLGAFLGIKGEGIPRKVKSWPTEINGAFIQKLGKIPRYKHTDSPI